MARPDACCLVLLLVTLDILDLDLMVPPPACDHMTFLVLHPLSRLRMCQCPQDN